MIKYLRGNLWWRQLCALVWKEFQQGVRDPSSYLVAVIMPLLFLLIFSYGVTLDAGVLRIAVINESGGQYANSLTLAFGQSPHFKVVPVNDRRSAQKSLQDAQLSGIIIVQNDFDTCMDSSKAGKVQLIMDGTEPNTAQFMGGYATGVIRNWQQGLAAAGYSVLSPIGLEERYWYNPSAKSQNFLVPGAITVIMTLIGTLLTSLVFAREWERGTMEAMFVTPATRLQILLGKLIPYFFIGMFSMVLCVGVSVLLFGLPFRGSIFALLAVSSVFMCAALGQGLLISVLLRVQLLAAQAGLFAGFLPALMLCGFMFDIDSMPLPLQYMTYLLPARYLNTCMRTLFLTGDVWAIFIPSILAMGALALLLLWVVYRCIIKRLDA